MILWQMSQGKLKICNFCQIPDQKYRSISGYLGVFSCDSSSRSPPVPSSVRFIRSFVTYTRLLLRKIRFIHQTLFNQVEHFIPNFKSFSKSSKYKILVMGIDTDDPDLNRTNLSISIAVQNFILKSKRFPDS